MEFIGGSIDLTNEPSQKKAWTALRTLLEDQDGYCGFRRPSLSAPNGEVPTFILIGPRFGICLIDLIEETIVPHKSTTEIWETTSGDSIYSRDVSIDNFESEIQNRLRQDLRLFDRSKNKSIVQVSKWLVFASNSDADIALLGESVGLANRTFSAVQFEHGLAELIASIENQEAQFDYSEVLALLEGDSAFRTKIVPRKIEQPTTMSDFIHLSLQHTFAFDKIQRQISVQLPPGPQRIRGLAGTGKTVILCAKAALAHKEFPDYKILFVFNTQSMYPQIEGRIADYYIRDARRQPNWDMLHVLHAWGGDTKSGLYSTICDSYGLKRRRFGEVRGFSDPLQYIYRELLEKTNSRFKKTYDLVLIDEAQDFPPELFEVIFYLTKEPKRIVWAYDEFQSLKELRIREPEDMFGRAPDGKPNMSNDVLEGKYFDEVDKDFILSNCYRNPRVNLMAAHGTGLGLYRKGGIIDIVGDKRSWDALGYRVEEPKKEKFSEGDDMLVRRPEEYSQNELEKILRNAGKDERDLVYSRRCESIQEQLERVAGTIASLVEKQGVAPEEIFVITLDTRNSNEHLADLRSLLDQRGIGSISPGFVEASSLFKQKGCVTLTTPWKAKGNESHVVVVLNANRAVSDLTFRSRTGLFVSITRSMGWCFIYGVGDEMTTLEAELNDITRQDYPCFHFKYPNEEDVERRRVILQTSDSDVERQQDLLDQVADKNPGLLVEKVLSSPDLLAQIRDRSEQDA